MKRRVTKNENPGRPRLNLPLSGQRPRACDRSIRTTNLQLRRVPVLGFFRWPSAALTNRKPVSRRESSVTEKGDGGSSPKLRGLDSNPHGAFGPRFWQAFRDTVVHLYDTVSLPDPSEEARFTLSTRTYPTPRAVLMRCQGTAFIMTRGPALVASGADPMLILLQCEGSVDTDCGARRGRIEAGDIAIFDYAQPFHSVATDYVNLIVHLSRKSVPAALLALEPHGLIFPRGSGAARLIGPAM